MSNILVTGGAGFIGSRLIRHWLARHPRDRIINVDNLTYAGNLSNLKEIENHENYAFTRADIRDFEAMTGIFSRHAIDAVIHLAAESHVDRSIADPFAFARTNVLGTLTLLQAASLAWAGNLAGKLFYHVSTDEVYGALERDDPPFSETTRYDPRSPYSASKASSDHFARAFHATRALPVKISNCSNNYGPRQFPEKLIPLFINNARQGKPLPLYGNGENIRDWIHVDDHARAIDLIFHEGRVGDTYNIGSGEEWRNIDLVKFILRVTDEMLERPPGTSEKLITPVADRPGHDARYAIDASKLRRELGWTPAVPFETGIRQTVRWYLDNTDWLDKINSGAYRDEQENKLAAKP
ncbi:MAG: dTDP-glucose 4,6-dehydratase [Odoribacteraceae bacterium]|jgi:dTDP-glucose 4,6-dehydratase|nr:dTDP-glucose 4,6-dehydratase [Odoribacteraceae bacterium]